MLGSVGKAAPAAPEKRELVFTLQRLDPMGDTLHGDLYLDGQHQCAMLERTSRAILAGRYQIVLTESGRAKAGTLWSPRDDHALPLLLDVKYRSGIRWHAANECAELEGCQAPGLVRDGLRIGQSRAALIKVMALIDAALALGESVYVDVRDA